MYRTLRRRIELNRQQQFRATLLAHQAKGDDLPPVTPGPRPKAKAKGKGGGRADGGDASRGRQRSSSQKSRAPACHCFPIGTPAHALEAMNANMSTSVLLTQRLKLKAKGRLRRPLGRVRTVLVHPDQGKQLASFSPQARANGETNAPLSTVAVMLPQPPLLPMRKPRLRQSQGKG